MKVGKYLIRSVKYLLYFILVFGVIVGILYLLELRKKNLTLVKISKFSQIPQKMA
mgnify:CR=1 FL=1